MNIKQIIREEIDDFDWIRDVEDDLIPGESYHINSDNGIYWSAETFLGKELDDEIDREMYRFGELGSDHGSHRMSEPYVKSLIQKGKIKPYDPNWSVLDEITFSDDINDVDNGNFVIYFENGAYLDQTIELQKILTKKGFSFAHKNLGEFITNKDFDGKIQFIESINWDTTNISYKSMPSDMRDRKKMLLSKVKDDDSWSRTNNVERKNQEKFRVVLNHNAIVINGDLYKTIINT